ncbi:hypothetical protein QUB25_22470 [Microcoleus sp. B3-D7]
MGIFHNHDPIFFYHKSSKSSTDNAFGGVVTPSGSDRLFDWLCLTQGDRFCQFTAQQK